MLEELINFIKTSLDNGTPKDQIRSSLNHVVGWLKKDIDLAFQSVEAPLGPNPSTPANPITNSDSEIVINKKGPILNPDPLRL